ncbi:MAG: MaoC family dehydratase [Halodesulfurarchaeum sp.]
MPEIYFEDLAEGEVQEFGSYEVTEDEILEFASRYDPQPFHTDPEAAADSIYGGLIASGWHTAAMGMRMVVEEILEDAASLGAIGVDRLRWHEPVRPGDTLSERIEVLEKRPSESKPDRGVVRIRMATLNQRDAKVLSMESIVLFGRRNAD